MALAFLLPVKMMAKASSSDNSTLLWYNAPAQQWLEALPIGNSHLGGMVYGGTTDENIQLNEETFWSGGPHNNNSKKSLENLPNAVADAKEKADDQRNYAGNAGYYPFHGFCMRLPFSSIPVIKTGRKPVPWKI